MHPTRPRAALLLLLALACADTALAQDPDLVSVPRGRRLPVARANVRANARALAAQCPAYAPLPEMRADSVLTMAPARFRIGDSTYRRNVYNGSYNAPVIRARRGDRLRFDVRNAMGVETTQPLDQIDTTNQHYHGMIVTPLPDTGDNVVPVVIPLPGMNRNSFFIPGLQSEGMMWYHPHPHGRTATQVAGGLAGALIIGDLLRSYTVFRGATERILYVKDTRDNTAFGGAYLNVNGNPCTGFTIAPGERQLWRIGNMTGATWLNLKLGRRGVRRGYPFIVLALDGNHLVRPTLRDSLFLAPGQRAEVIIIGGMGPDSVAFYTDSIRSSFNPQTGVVNPPNPRVDLGFLKLRSPRALRAAEAFDAASQPPDLVLADSIRKLVTDPQVDRFTLRYSFARNPTRMMLNDSVYDPRRLDRAVAVGRTQEWTLINDTWFLHTFHIHQTDFVVTRINGKVQADSVHLDNVHLGIHPVGGGRWAGDTVVIRFTFNRIAAGPFVYHCHDLVHEDLGMMANICVYNPDRGETPETCRQWFPGGSGGHAHATARAATPRAHPHAAAPAPAPASAPVRRRSAVRRE